MHPLLEAQEPCQTTTLIQLFLYRGNRDLHMKNDLQSPNIPRKPLVKQGTCNDNHHNNDSNVVWDPREKQLE